MIEYELEPKSYQCLLKWKRAIAKVYHIPQWQAESVFLQFLLNSSPVPFVGATGTGWLPVYHRE